MKNKTIKVSTKEYDDILEGRKTFLVEYKSNNFQVGDTITVKECTCNKESCPRCTHLLADESCTCGELDKPTGNKVKCEIIYIEDDMSSKLASECCKVIMSIILTKQDKIGLCSEEFDNIFSKRKRYFALEKNNGLYINDKIVLVEYNGEEKRETGSEMKCRITWKENFNDYEDIISVKILERTKNIIPTKK
jgi:hypothetical protein